MVVFIKIILVLIAVAIAFFLTVRLTGKKGKKDTIYDDGETNISVRPIGLVVGAVLIILSSILAGAIGQVSAGHRGVVLNFGAVTERTLGEGIYLITPLSNTVETMDVQTHAYEAEASAASKDMQEVHTKVTLNYALDPAKVNEVYRTLRRDYVERIIKPAVQESVKAVTARFDAEKLITQRQDVKISIEEALKTRLAFHGITSETISITDFQFSKTFTDAIEAKQVAVQDAQKAENKLRQIEWEAKQAKEAARGQADAAIEAATGQKQSAILQAEGDAQATLTRAGAQAKANELLAESLRNQPELLKYVLYQKLGDDIRVIILPSGQEFILGPEVLGTK